MFSLKHFGLLFFLAYMHVLFSNFKEKPLISKIESLEELGHHLFFDQQLSPNSAKACASCHEPQFAFSDGYKKSVGLYGDHVIRNAPSLINVRDRFALTWANDTLTSLEQQMLRPMFGDTPPEMGVKGHEELVLKNIAKRKEYLEAFARIFPNDQAPINFINIIHAIASYEKKLISYNSPYDRFLESKDTVEFGYRAKRGMDLFFSDRLSCGNCHNGRNLDEPDRGFEYSNVGLYFCDEWYPNKDMGLFSITKDSIDIGRFRIPSLRNVALTAPYFHDGSTESLDEVLEIYSRGGRINLLGDCKGDGSLHPNRDPRMADFTLTKEEKTDVLHFLFALTDTSYLANPYFRNPFAF
ncbi:MAG: di-heme enzyme [Saprospiraceae bacterium]|nr:di-heme enzyme [Saprospiraceae bacterium]